MHDRFNLNRFLVAQEARREGYKDAISELRQGRKSTHWMWYIFPQIKGLGLSHATAWFSISGTDEAKAYLEHPVLGARLKECTQAVLKIDTNSIRDIFAGPDDLKFRSSMTLFDFVEPNTIFAQALRKFFDSADGATLSKLRAKE